MPWGAVVGAVIGGVAANSAAKKGAAATDKASQGAIDLQREQFNITRQDRAPWMQAGQGALSQMQALNSGDFSSFHESPDYQFTRDQGLQSLERGAAARGGMYSGGADADRMRFASGLANQQYGTFYSRLSDLANGGNATAGSLGQMGMNMATNSGNSMMDAAQQRSSAYNQIGSNYGQMAGIGGNAFAQWYQNNKTQNGGGSGWYLGNNPGQG